MLKKLFYEPLVHFLLLGGLIFLFYVLSQSDENIQKSIVISKERIDKLTSDWEKKFLSIPTEEEKKVIIDKEIYETIFYREALKIGLDKTDIEIKRHIAQKMEFISYDKSALPPPSDKVLKKFMLENPKKYKKEEKIHFTQITNGLNETLFEKEYNITQSEASSIFGRAFSEVIFTLNASTKVHKIESENGVHEVVVLGKSKTELKDFDDVKAALQSDYLGLKREQNNKTIYEALKLNYLISIGKE